MKVKNKRTDKLEPGDIYVGRPTKWGNPFVIGSDGGREDVVRKYCDWLLRNPALVAQAKKELCGHNLVCWCAPHKCHADILMMVANSKEE